MTIFDNLSDAGDRLAALVQAQHHGQPVIVLGVVPNGVPVALPVARVMGVRVVALPALRTADGPVISAVLGVGGAHVIVIDDGVETGMVARAAAAALVGSGAASITLAVPVCSRDAMADLSLRFDSVIAVDKPLARRSLAWHYQDFDVIDEETALGLIANQV